MSERFDLDRYGETPRIAVVVRDHMSGVLYSVPSLRAIRRRWPEAHITLLTSSYSAPVIDGACPYLDRVLPLYTFSDTPGRFDRLRDYASKATTWLRMVGRVDLVIHLRSVGNGTLLACALMGLPDQVGYSQRGRFDRFLTHSAGLENPELGSRERNQIILESIGIEPDGDHMELSLPDRDRAWARRWLAGRGHEPSEHLTIVHPGSHWGCNQWLPDRWAETIERVLADKGGLVVITGVERELPLAERIAASVDGRVEIAAGETDLRQYAALIGEADLVLAIDAAPTQICQALDVPAVIMMGAGNPAWNGPVPSERMLMLQEWDNDDPRPEICNWLDGACNGPQCQSRLEDISVTQVLESVEELRRLPARR